MNWIILNTHKPPFNNVHARRALAFALDRARMVAALEAATCRRRPVRSCRPGSPATGRTAPSQPAATATRWTAPDLARRASGAPALGHARRACAGHLDRTRSSGVDAQNAELAATLRKLGYRVTFTRYATDPAYFSADVPPTRSACRRRGQRLDPRTTRRRRGSSAASTVANSPYICDKAYGRELARTSAAATAPRLERSVDEFDRKVTDRALVIPYLNQKAIDFVVEAGRELPAPSRVRPADRPGVGAVTGGAGRRRASTMPDRDQHAAGDLKRRSSTRESRITAKIAATNGCRFVGERRPRRPDPVERAEPEHVRQHERAENREGEEQPDARRPGPSPGSRSAARRRPRAPAPSRPARARSRGTASSSPSAARSAPSSAAHVAAVSTASRIPTQARPRPRRPRRSRRARRRRTRRSRRARSGRRRRSRPSARPNSAAKIGVAPSTRPTVDAVVCSSE